MKTEILLTLADVRDMVKESLLKKGYHVKERNISFIVEKGTDYYDNTEIQFKGIKVSVENIGK